MRRGKYDRLESWKRKKRMWERYDAGDSLEDIGAAYGISPYTANMHINDWSHARKGQFGYGSQNAVVKAIYQELTNMPPMVSDEYGYA